VADIEPKSEKKGCGCKKRNLSTAKVIVSKAIISDKIKDRKLKML